MKTIARVEVADCPDSVRTLAEWAAWRKAEDARIMAQLEKQLEEYFTAQAAERKGLFAEGVEVEPAE
jgi:hypothetical protein